jgi:hypothetical protein
MTPVKERDAIAEWVDRMFELRSHPFAWFPWPVSGTLSTATTVTCRRERLCAAYAARRGPLLRTEGEAALLCIPIAVLSRIAAQAIAWPLGPSFASVHLLARSR